MGQSQSDTGPAARSDAPKGESRDTAGDARPATPAPLTRGSMLDSGALAASDPVQSARLRALGIIPANDEPPFDIIGDAHGCIEELRKLLGCLGYQCAADSNVYSHPQGRRLVFVGDLVDRGPASMDVLRLVIATYDAGHALLVLGNHDSKFLRWLRGNNVHIGHGLEKTILQLEAVPWPQQMELRREIERLYSAAPGYLLLDGGRLVVTHGAILDTMIGEWNEHIARFCRFADVIGHTADGRPIRRDWGAMRDLAAAGGEHAPAIIYGHNPVPNLAWVNRTLDLDTGVVYGGYLSALRYPEMGTVQVAAERAYSAYTPV
jgi:protein phosphatase